MQDGFEIITSTNCKSKLQFRQTNNYQLLFITSTMNFQPSVVIGKRNAHFQSTENPGRWLPFLNNSAYINFSKA